MLVLAAAAQAQRVRATEWSAGVVGVIATRDFWGGDLGLARRAGGRRLALDVAGGALGGDAALRARGTVQILLRPGARSGVSPFGALGIAWAGAADTHGAAYLALVGGVETAPAQPRGWYLEVGVEGGFRLAAGLRLRRVKRGV